MDVEPSEFFVGFVAHEYLHEEIIPGGVEIVKGQDFTSNLDTVILK